jgi:type II secretory pathway predicted ATPase ExeA
MYERFYNLREPPFELTGDVKYLFLTARQREALSNLEYGLFAAKSLTLLTGEPGTGKTTLLRAAFASERCRDVKSVFITNPTLTRDEFVDTLIKGFDLEASQSKSVFLGALERELVDRRSHGTITALIVDEAQSLSLQLLEEIRLLGNLETATEKLLPIVLAGQPEFAARLEDPALRQLKQRVALRCETAPFDLEETAGYVAARIQTGGGNPLDLFTQEAIIAIHEYSRGIARTINVMCDNALVSGLALQRRPVDRSVVLEVCRDFFLHRPTSAVAPAASADALVRSGAGGPGAPPRDAIIVADQKATDSNLRRRLKILGARR